MSEKKLLNKVKSLLGLEIKLEQMKLDNGAVLEAEVFEANAEVFVVNGEERVALPIGEYTLENGQILVIAEEGIIAEIKESEAKEEAPKEVSPEMPMESQESTPKKIIESISKEMFFEEIEKLQKQIEEIKLSKVEVVEEVELEKVEPLKHSPEALVSKQNYLYSQKRQKTTKDLIYEKLFKN